jgi:hypothetical protein
MSFKALLVLVMVGVAFGACSVYDNGQPDKIVSVSSEMSQSGPTVAELQVARANLHRVLINERVTLAELAPVTVQVTEQELLDLAQQDMNEREVFPGPKLVGMVKPVFAAIDLAPVQIESLTNQAKLLDLGAIRAVDDGFVYTTTVRSEGAESVRVHISDLSLPANVELYVFNQDGDAHGPYVGMGPNDTGEFWTPSVKGSELFVQVRHYGVATRDDLISTWFVIDEVGHIAEGGIAEYGLGERCYTADCTKNASCGAGPLAGSEGAIAHYTYVKRPYVYMCSGGLLADSDPSTQIPYFLTANHCLSKQKDANSAEFYFDFQTPCGTTCGDNANAIEVSGGAEILSTGSAADYTLMVIKQPVPAGRVFLGWTNAEVAFTDDVKLHRLAHPNGGPMAYSAHTVDTSWGTCTGWDRGDRIYSTDTYGNTEGGSSGSPVLNDAGEVVGQLSGACGLDPYADCRPDINATVDGALAAYYGDVTEWLGTGEPPPPPPSCIDDPTICGAGELCCNDECVAPACNSDANCDDGNPCTTDTCSLGGTCDAACQNTDIPDCTSCLPLGDACTDGAECCSGKCKGKPGSTICR